jgi:hypothetical protein
VSDFKIALVHLDRRTAETVSPGEELRRESVGGAALNLALLGQYGTGSLVFGAGPLAGTLAPASALLVASFTPSVSSMSPAESAPSPAIRHVPLLLTAGPDLRCSGIDYLVLTGVADRPTLLHIDGGRVRFLDPPAPATDLPSLEASLRRCAPPCRTAILTSSAADAGAAFASVSLGRKGSLDRAGLAGAMAARNLKGILLGATGGIGFAAEDLARSLTIAGKIKKLRKKAGGFDALVKAMGGGDGLKALKGASLHEAACFHCPAPCMVHARFDAVDPRLPQGPKKQIGLLLMDHRGFMALAKKRPGTALPLLAESIRLGLDPCAVASLLSATGEKETFAADFALLEQAGETPDSSPNHPETVGTASGFTSPPQAASDLLSRGSLPLPGTGDEVRRLTAQAFVLGVCPIFMQRFPEVAGDLAAFLPAEVSTASLSRAAETILSRE